jgi:hypothetical protein
MILPLMLASVLAFTVLLTSPALTQQGAQPVEARPAAAEPAEQPAADTPEDKPAPVPLETPSADQRQAESVLKYVPADCMGAYIVPNMKDLLAATETYAKDIGLGEELGNVAPQGLLKTITQQLKVSKGYNPNGGLALVVLDFEQAGIDLSQMFQGGRPPSEPPFVILLAGKDVQSVFPTRTVQNEDGSVSVQLIDSPSAVEEMGDYLAISPYPDGIRMLKEGQNVLETLGKDKIDLLQKGLFGYYYNMGSAVTMMKQVSTGLEAQQQQMENEGYGPQEEMMMSLGIINMSVDAMAQLVDVISAVRIEETGMIAETLVDYKPESVYGQQVASLKPAGGELLSRVPDMPYVMAMGSDVPGLNDNQAVRQGAEIVDLALEAMNLEMPADMKSQLIELSTDFNEQVRSMQIVAGGSKADGVFGTVLLLDVKSAEATRDLITRETNLLTTLVAKTLAQKEEDLTGLEFKYNKATETSGTVAVDTIEVLHPDLQELSERERKDMQRVLGEERLLIRVAPIDLNTVVVSFGGGQGVLGQAIDAAQKGGTIEADAGVQEALQHLPGQRVAVMLFSPQNLWQTVVAEAEQQGEKATLPGTLEDFKWSTQTPVAMGMTAEGSQARVAWYVPTALVKDSVDWFMTMEQHQQEQRRRWREQRNAEKQSTDPPPANDF